MNEKKPSEVLKDALALLDGGKAWTKGSMAKDKYGIVRDFDHPDAVCQCPVGAVHKIVGYRDGCWITNKFLDPASGRNDAVGLNDASTTTFADIEAMFQRAIKMARAAGE